MRVRHREGGKEGRDDSDNDNVGHGKKREKSRRRTEQNGRMEEGKHSYSTGHDVTTADREALISRCEQGARIHSSQSDTHWHLENASVTTTH